MRISDWSSDVCSSDLGRRVEKGITSPSRQGNRLCDQRQFAVGESVELGDGALDRLGDRVRPEAELLRPDEGDVGDPHEAEQGPKVRLLAVAGDARSLTVEPAARFDQDRKSVV